MDSAPTQHKLFLNGPPCRAAPVSPREITHYSCAATLFKKLDNTEPRRLMTGGFYVVRRWFAVDGYPEENDRSNRWAAALGARAYKYIQLAKISPRISLVQAQLSPKEPDQN